MASLIDLFVAAVEPACESERQNIWWTGVAVVSSIVNRLVWTSVRAGTASDRLFGNLFILLVGPPGVGKTTPINYGRRLAMKAAVRLGPDDCSGERLIHFTRTNDWGADWGADEHKEAVRRRRLGKPDGVDEDTGLASPRGVLALFLNEFDHLFHGGSALALKRVLTDFYDCRSEPYSRETYQHGTQVVEQMCMTLIGAATPAHMAKVFSRDEWQEGLPSRFVYVWAGDRLPMKESFEPALRRWKAAEEAAGDVAKFALEHQALGWAKDAAAERLRWRRASVEGGPGHPLLAGYNTRRYVSACKLALVLAAARLSPLIELADWSAAVGAIAETEAQMEKTLAQAGGNELRPAMSWVVAWVRASKRVDEASLRRKLGQMLPPQLVNALIEEMIRSRVLIAAGVVPARFFSPGEPEPRPWPRK